HLEVVARVDRRGQPELHIVGEVQRLLEIARRLQRQDRPEDFLTGQLRARLDLVEDRRRAEEAALVCGRREPLAAAEEPRAFGLGGGDGLEVIAAAKAEGARLLCGGERLSSAAYERGFFCSPTVFDKVEPGTKLAREEVFGPVLALQSARDFEEALHLANDVQFGLTASIYSRDYFQVMRFVEKAEVGMVHVN